MTQILPVKEIEKRLKDLIPKQVDPRGWARREMAAKTVFVMLYGFAIEGEDRWIRPTAVTDMTDGQAERQTVVARKSWLERVQSRNRPRQIEGRWYQENTREPIRDETLRTLVKLGIAIEREVPTTSPKPRYALARSFVDLMSPALSGDTLRSSLEAWRKINLNKAMMARLALVRKGKGADTKRVLVSLPTGETRALATGPSATLTKAVVEEFAPRFLADPAVVLVSESAHKIGFQNDELLELTGLSIDSRRTLPDLVLMDLNADPPLLVFVECVVSDGPVDARRRTELDQLARESDFALSSVTYVTAFHDRAGQQFRRMVTSIAWSSFVWFETEPDHIVHLRSGETRHRASLRELIDAGE